MENVTTTDVQSLNQQIRQEGACEREGTCWVSHGGPRRRSPWRGVCTRVFPEAALVPCLWPRLTGDTGPRGQVLVFRWLLAADSEAPSGNPPLPWPGGLGFWERVSLSVDGDNDADCGSFEVWPGQHLDQSMPGPSPFPMPRPRQDPEPCSGIIGAQYRVKQ